MDADRRSIVSRAGVVRRWCGIFALAGIFTLLNCVKPLHIDDPCFYDYAVQAAKAPLDPYGFEIFWFQHPQPSIELPVPPVVPYYLAPAVHFFPDQPIIWKLWFFPVGLLLVVALDVLLRRFAPRHAVPLLWMTVLSPTVLPGFNLMLDVPALGLSLGSLVLFIRAVDRSSWQSAVAAGIVAALAIQAKYNALAAPAAILLYGLAFGQFRLAMLAATVSGGLFVGIEGLFALEYGQSHFLAALEQNDSPLRNKPKFLTALFAILGGTHGAGALLGMLALGQPPRRLAVVAGLLAAGYLGIAVLPTAPSEIVANVVFGLVGAVLLGSVALAARELCGMRGINLTDWADWRGRRGEWFLLAWFLLELVAYVVISPFIAVRRVLGVLVVATLLVGRLLDQRSPAPHQSRLSAAVAAGCIVLGVAFAGMDYVEAETERQAVLQTAAFVAEQDGSGGVVWYAGHWGFQFYAEQAGMRPVVPDVTQMRAGDWFIQPDLRIARQQIATEVPTLQLVHHIALDDWLPLRTVANYYAGRRPLERREGPRVTVEIYRVTEDFVATTPAPYAHLARAIRRER